MLCPLRYFVIIIIIDSDSLIEKYNWINALWEILDIFSSQVSS